MADPDRTPTERLRDLIGVRATRNGPVIFAEAADVMLRPGQVVVVERIDTGPRHESRKASANGPMLALVAIGSGQLVADAAGIEPSVRVTRVASAAEARAFADSSGQTTPERSLREAGMPEGWDAWLSAGGEAPAISVDSSREATSAGAFIKRLFPNPRPPRRRRGGGSADG